MKVGDEWFVGGPDFDAEPNPLIREQLRNSFLRQYPNFKAEKYTIIDICPDGTVVSESEHGHCRILRNGDKRAVQLCVNHEWLQPEWIP